MSSNRVLIVYPECAFATALATAFENTEFEVRTTADSREGAAIADWFEPSLVIADLDLLAADEFILCETLRHDAITNAIRVLMLSNGRNEELELLGLDRGADDYLVRPFPLEHLMHRVRVLIKRKSIHEQENLPIRLNGLELDIVRQIGLLHGFDLKLTATELRLVWTMAQKPGHVFDRLELVNRSRGKDANCSERTIDAHVRSIRVKLGTSGKLIETVHGVGYRVRAAVIPSMFENRTDLHAESDAYHAQPEALQRV